MPDFFKGVGIGTHWHKPANDPRINGFSPHNPGTYDITSLVDHIANATTFSPYISLTRSYEVAEKYAIEGSRKLPTATLRPYVFRIRIPDPTPTGLFVYDPLCEITGIVPTPLSVVPYQHNGGMDVIIGIVQPNTPHGRAILGRPVRLFGGTTGISGPNISPELNAMVRALRDSEVLCLGVIPPALILGRYSV